jgi:hypothetical protein
MTDDADEPIIVDPAEDAELRRALDGPPTGIFTATSLPAGWADLTADDILADIERVKEQLAAEFPDVTRAIEEENRLGEDGRRYGVPSIAAAYPLLWAISRFRDIREGRSGG